MKMVIYLLKQNQNKEKSQKILIPYSQSLSMKHTCITHRPEQFQM